MLVVGNFPMSYSNKDYGFRICIVFSISILTHLNAESNTLNNTNIKFSTDFVFLYLRKTNAVSKLDKAFQDNTMVLTALEKQELHKVMK